MANKNVSNQNLAMKEVLIAMHKLGGQVTRKDIRNEISDSSNFFLKLMLIRHGFRKKQVRSIIPFITQ